MDSLFHLLYKIRKNPALYFGGRENLALLRAFIDGYIARQRETDGNFRGTFALNGFQEFVQDRYEIVSVHSWDKIIDFYSSNDREAFETFFKLLDEFHGTEDK